MRKKCEPESDQHRSDRLANNAQERRDNDTQAGGPSRNLAPGRNLGSRNAFMRNGNVMKSKSFTAFRSAAEEAVTKRDNDAMGRADHASEEGGHMSSTEGRVVYVPGAELPYVVILAHHRGGSSEHAFATMRQAESFIKWNTPLPRAVLSTTYDRPAPDPSPNRDRQ